MHLITQFPVWRADIRGIKMNKQILFFIAFLSIFSIAFATAPTYGSGTIQDCQTGDYDYCNVTSSSTISGQDFIINNRELIFAPGVTVTLNASRLSINSTERIWIQSSAVLDGSGFGRNGGSGGSIRNIVNPPSTQYVDGATNGSNGSVSNGCLTFPTSYGSGLLPFEFTPGNPGIQNGSVSLGGGFYSTGAAGIDSATGCFTAGSGGSGHAIRLISSNITIQGTVNVSADIGTVDGGGGAYVRSGGSGAGELILYGSDLTLTGSISANGADGLGAFGAIGNGGDGGRYKACAKNVYSNSTIVTVLGGLGGALNGSTGISTISSSNTSCYPDVSVDLFSNNNTVFTPYNPGSFSPSFLARIGVFNSSNVTCDYIVDGTHTPIGQFNYTDGFVTINVSIPSQSTGTHTFAVTCANSSAGIVNVTSSLSFSMAPGPQVSAIQPTNSSTIASGNTNIIYGVLTDRAVTCNLTLNLVPNASSSVPFSTSITNPVSLSLGPQEWGVFCYEPGNMTYNSTANFSFIYSISNSTTTVFLLNTTDPVLTSIASYNNLNAKLRLIYYLDRATDLLVYQELSGLTLNTTYNTSINRGKDFFLIMNYPTSTLIDTYSTNGSSRETFTITNGISTSITSTPYNILSNNYFDAGQYAYTEHVTPVYGSSSYYLYWLPVSTGSVLMRQNITATSPDLINGSNHNRSIVWQTITNNSALSNWYYAAPTNCTATTDYIGIYQYNGTGTTLLNIPNSNCYNQTAIEGSKVIFEGYGNKSYALFANLTNATLHLVQDNKTITFNNSISSPSSFIFNDQYTFNFFSIESGTTYVYDCYFETTASCSKFTLTEWRQSVSYSRSNQQTSKRNSTADSLTYANVFQSSGVYATVVRSDYNSKFICYDEQLEYRKQFQVRMFSDNASIVFTNSTWGYSIPSENLGNGTKRTYFLCTNGTNRLMVNGLNGNYHINSFSLLSTAGTYYTFNVRNNFGIPIENARVSAYRFSNLFQQWVTIEQGITDATGTAVLFLEPLNLYRIILEADGYVALNFDFVPASTTSITLQLNSEGGQNISLPEFDRVFDDVSISVRPDYSFSTNATNLSFQVVSNSSTIENFSLIIYRRYGGNTTVVFNSTVTSQPSGGILNYTATQIGQYVIVPSFTSQNYSTYYPGQTLFTLGNNTGLARARVEFESDQPMSGWTFYFLAIVCAMLAAGFVSRYSYEGAGLAAIVVLWIFTLFSPGLVLVSLGGQSITVMMATTLSTVLTIVAVYLMNRVGA